MIKALPHPSGVGSHIPLKLWISSIEQFQTQTKEINMCMTTFWNSNFIGS
jgi:hypothetical protein